MELHPEDGQLAMAHRHDDAVAGAGADDDLLGERLFVHHQRMIPAREERAGGAAEEGALVVDDLFRLSVHRRAGAHDASTESLSDALVAEADAEDGDGPGALLVETAEPPDRPQANAGFV